MPSVITLLTQLTRKQYLVKTGRKVDILVKHTGTHACTHAAPHTHSSVSETVYDDVKLKDPPLSRTPHPSPVDYPSVSETVYDV